MNEVVAVNEPAAPTAARLSIAGPFRGLPVTLSPDPVLLKYYLLSSFLAGPFFLFPFIPMYFRFRSMEYHVDEEGIRMRWGILFRREITLTYARIQDIHLSSNFVERWLGIARIQVQTASGSATAEMTIEGLKEYEAIRDFLYSRMRGARELNDGSAPATEHPTLTGSPEDLADTLRAIAAEIRALREQLPPPPTAGGPGA